MEDMVRGKNKNDKSPSSSLSINLNRKATTATNLENVDKDKSKSNENEQSATPTGALVEAHKDSEATSTGASCWDNLPSVILLEIFSYLPQEFRIQASQVCRHWRYALFHPSFWKKITFSLINDESIIWARNISNCFKYSVQDVTVRCESGNNFVREAFALLKKLNGNRQLKKLYLEPTRCMFENPTQEIDPKKLMKIIHNIVESSNCMDTLTLGCIEELTNDLTSILIPLKDHQANNITHLGLSSVKDDPEHYDFLDFDCSLLTSFPNLTLLSIDYDHLSDELLNALNSGVMERLVINVQGWNGDYPGAHNDTWTSFIQKNPLCELRLNLIHSYNAVQVLDSEILKPAMPLTHLKVLFCEDVNLPALNLISSYYSESLQSLVWIDSINTKKNFVNSLHGLNNIDPLVLAAWRCKNLTEIVFIGQKYLVDNLLAIVRLRHDMLKQLEFAECDIIYEDSERSEILDEINDVMGNNWKLVANDELPTVIVNPLKGDSREVIMPMILEDHK